MLYQVNIHLLCHISIFFKSKIEKQNILHGLNSFEFISLHCFRENYKNYYHTQYTDEPQYFSSFFLAIESIHAVKYFRYFRTLFNFCNYSPQ